MLYRLLADEPKEDVKATVEALKATTTRGPACSSWRSRADIRS